MAVSVGTTPLSVLNTVFGYPSFRGHQAEVIAHVGGGGDALVLMPTGSGKSLCYQIPALLRDGVGVVVSPLISLMQDQVAALAELGVRAAFLNSTLTGAEAFEIERQVRHGELDLVYVAPERLLTDRCLSLLASSKLALFAIDEAHCVSQWGHDFRPEYIQLSVLHERFPAVPRIALTATADAQTRAEIILRLQLGQARVFVSSFDRPNIRYRVVEKGNARKQLLDFISAEHAGDAGIVYCLSRKKVDETAAFLKGEGITALPYHAGMTAEARQKNQARFQRDDGGGDRRDDRLRDGHRQTRRALCRAPRPAEEHRGLLPGDRARGARRVAGGRVDGVRTSGRGAAPAHDRRVGSGRGVQEESRPASSTRCSDSAKRPNAAVCGCSRTSARRARACNNCDTCLDPPASFDGTIAVQQLLSCIYRTGQRFGAMHVIDVLHGEDTEKVLHWRHHELSTFGIGRDRGAQEWRAIIRQCIALGLIVVDHDAYSALKLTRASRAVLTGAQRVPLREWRKAEKVKKARRTAAIADDLPTDAHELFEQLRAWRLEAARQHGVPAYVIFHDATLKEIARTRPSSLAALRGIPGVGVSKLERYGEDIVRLVG